MTDYQIGDAPTVGGLAAIANANIREGWEPQGGVDASDNPAARAPGLSAHEATRKATVNDLPHRAPL
jgi:hypothetical protein